ncbi:MAG: tRNA-dihydrouridine synthase family protein [Promethearchaeota archaeon]|nr:MAG: tRNA-dihydrouridine synthase family protein [Candidatus Lokiarchaeota archaeon]
MKLGSLYLKNNLVLSPLLNITTPVYRRFCRHFSEIGLVCAPMLYAKKLQTDSTSAKLDLHKIEQESPISVQLIGNDEKAIMESIRILESYEFNVLDFNAGCPSRRAILGKYGGYLLKDLDRLKRLVHMMIKHSSRPVSLKIRTGFEEEVNIKEFAKFVNNSNVEFVTIHARTVKDRFDESALNLEFVKKLKNNLNIPVVGNGDVFTPEAAKYFLNKTGVDALMVGRGSMGNPRIFHQINEYLVRNKKISLENNKNVMKHHLEIYEKILDEYLQDLNLPRSKQDYRFVELKRNAIWLTKNLENSTILRRRLSKTRNLEQLKQCLIKFIDINSDLNNEIKVRNNS